MTVLWGVIAFLFLCVAVVSIVDLLGRHLGAGRTAAWTLLIIIFPIVGSLIYWAMRKPPQDELELNEEVERELRRGSSSKPGNTRLGS